MAEEEDDDYTMPEPETFFDAMEHFPLPTKRSQHQQERINLDPDSNHFAADEIKPVRFRRRRRRSSSSFSPPPPTSSTSQVITSADSAASRITWDRIGVREVDSSTSGFLLFVAGLLIKALAFEIGLVVSSILFPFRLLRLCFVLVTDPFGAMRNMRDGMSDRMVRAVGGMRERFGSVAVEWVGMWQPGAIRVAWGCFWSLYVGFVLVGCLLTAFLVGRLLLHYAVEEPVWISGELSFDYTNDSPVAVVPVTPCDGVRCRVGCEEVGDVGNSRRWRRIPLDHKLRLIVLLTMPESDYNRNLGMFQVKAQFLTANGKVSASSSRPCMLKYKSSPIRYLETAFKSGLILAGYSSESQIVKLKMEGLIEETESTVCIRVVIEKRAEYRPGYGIPEIYAASVELESELPLFKKIIWNWRKTIFIWIAMGLFIFEILIVLVCCRSLIVPRTT